MGKVDVEPRYHSHVLGLSQRDPDLFRALTVIGRRRVLWGLTTIFKIAVPADESETVIRSIQRNMSRRVLCFPQEFYAHFYRGSELIIVYRDRVFRVTTDRKTWREALAHGRALGIAERQLDFSPCRLEDETY